LTENSTFGMAGRAYSTFIKTHTRATINSAYGLAKSLKLRYRLSYLDEQVPYTASDPFNAEYMRRLYVIGRNRGFIGDWEMTPPAAESSIE
jgi:hypothetical protein